MLCLVTKTNLRVVRELTEKEADAIRDPLLGGSTGELALAVLREGRENDLWLRCDCRIDVDDYPLVAPCRMPEGAGYSWRVLHGKNRPQHHPDCVFYRESREERVEKNWRRAARVRPEGYFAALRARKSGNAAESLAGEDGTALTDPLHTLGEDSDREPGRRRMPALPVLLYLLLETAGLTRVRAKEPAPGIGGWTEAMSAAAKTIEIRARTPLGRAPVPVAHRLGPAGVCMRRFGRPRGSSRSAMCRRALCAFRYVTWERGPCRRPASTESLKWSRGSSGPLSAGRAVSGPYLFFGVVALTTRRRGYECVRGWAQPIVSVHRPVPVDSDFERQALRYAHDDAVDVGQGVPGYRVHDGEAGVRHRHQARAVPAGLPHPRAAAGRGANLGGGGDGLRAAGTISRQGGHARAHGGTGTRHPHGREAVRTRPDRRGAQGDGTDPRRHGGRVVRAAPGMLTRLGLVLIRRPGPAPPGRRSCWCGWDG